MRILLIALAVIALIVVGMVFVGGSPPAIIVSPEVVFPEPFGLPLDVTNTMFTSWLVVIGLCLLAVIVGPRISVVPSGFSGFVEAIVSAFYNIVVGVAGEENGKRFFPLVATIFFFILVSNYAGLLPGNAMIGLPVAQPTFTDNHTLVHQTNIAGIDLAYVPFTPPTYDYGAGEVVELEEPGGSFSGVLEPYIRAVMTDLNAPLAIAIFSFIFVEFWGLQSLGIGYLGKFFNFGRLLRGNPMGIIDVFVGLLEFVSELSRVVSFTFRLFGNIFAGEVLLLMMTFLVPFVLVNVFYGLELFVGLVQAFVFAMLTLVFAVTAVAHHGQHDDHEHVAPEADLDEAHRVEQRATAGAH